MRPPLRPNARRGAALATTLVVSALAISIAALLVSLSTDTVLMNHRARAPMDARRVSRNTLEYLVAQVQARWDATDGGKPTTAHQRFVAEDFSAADKTALAEKLGLDTERYTLVSASAGVDKEYPGYKTYFPNPIPPGGSIYTIDPNAPQNFSDPAMGNTINECYSLPLFASVTISPRNAPNSEFTVTTRAVLQKRYGTLFQYCLYFNQVSPSLWGGAWNYKGGIHSNQAAYFYSTWNAQSSKMESAILIEKVKAPLIFFGRSPMQNGEPMSATTRKVYANSTPSNPVGSLKDPDLAQHIFISMGDINGDHKLTPWSGTNVPLAGMLNPTEYRSVNQTLWDYYGETLPTAEGGTMANPFNNYRVPDWFKDHATGGARNKAASTIIDSAHPNFATLQGDFKGSLKDSTTGWEEVLPVGISKKADPRSLILPPVDYDSLEPKTPEPISAAEKAANPTLAKAWADYRAGKADHLAAEETKYANKTHFYVYVETPAAPGENAKVTIFNDPAAAQKYKATAPTDRAEMRLQLAEKILVLPEGIKAIETSRTFFDRTQSSGTTEEGNSMRTPRVQVSAIDIDIGALRKAVAPGGADIKTANGKAWDLDNRTSGWNGIMYVDVDNPRSAGWSGAATWDDSLPSGTVTNLNAVRLHNAEALPDRSASPSYKQPEGFAIATNTAVYSVGNVNADGKPDTDISFGSTSSATEYIGTDGKRGTTISVEQNSLKGAHHFPVTIAGDSFTWMPAAHTNPEGTMVPSGAKNADGTDVMVRAYDLALGDAKVNANPYGTAYDAGNNVFQELNFSYIGGGANQSKNHAAARVLNFFAGSRNIGSRQRYRGSANVLFESQYNRKFYDSAETNTLGFDFGFDKNINAGFTAPGTPGSTTYQLVNTTETASSK